MAQLFKQSFRSLAKRPGFSLFVILILALCVGGNASIFSAAKAVLFQELPFKDVGRLVLVSSFYVPNASETDVSWIETKDWARRAKLLEKVSPFCHTQDRLLVQGDGVERVEVNYVEPDFFALLGVEPHLGRTFTAEENRAPGSASSAVISHNLWQRLYAKDPAIVGKEIRLNSQVYNVVGVMPEDFHNFLMWRYPQRHDLWLPAVMAGEAFRPGTPLLESRDERVWSALARLKPGATLEQAEREVESIAAQLATEFPDSNRDYTVRLLPLREYMFGELFDGMKVLFAGSLLVLLIGCANIANLLLVRLTERRREFSLRLSLGASRWQLIRQVLAESSVLALLGGTLGVVLAVWGVKLMRGLLELPPFAEVRLDGAVLAITLVVTLLTGLLFALPPALSVARMESQGVLQQVRAAGGRTHSAQGRTGLLVFQVAIVVVLLVVAGLLLRSFLQLRAASVDVETANLLTLPLSFRAERYDERPNIPLAMQEILRRLERTPGVEDAATWGSSIPGMFTQFTDILPETAGPDEPTLRTDMHRVSPGALAMIGVRLLKGREFTDHDNSQVPRVAIMSKSLAEVLWPGQDPMGKRIYRPGRDNDERVTIVGLTPDLKLQGRFVEGNHHLFYPLWQSPTAENTTLLVRTSAAEASILPVLRSAVKQVDPNIPVYNIASLEDRLRGQEREFRLNASIVGLYAALALTLALLGLYSMLAYSVLQRTPEIGVRLALGAERHKILRMMMSRGLLLAFGGLALGIAGALVLTRFLSSLLFGVKDKDPLTFLLVIGLFTVVALLATYLPARRTLRVDPTIALRFE